MSGEGNAPIEHAAVEQGAVEHAPLEHAAAGQLRQLLDAVLAIGGNLDLEVVLQRVVKAAVGLVGAKYGALGVLDVSRTHLVEFVTTGLTQDERDAIGDNPKGHGILGLLIADPRPIRLPDLAKHPESFGFPPGHPPMTTFLGVPILIGGEAFGNLYLTEKAGGEPFSEIDEELAIGLAAAAAAAIDNARLHARAREVDLIEDRERIARELHDTVIQRLFAAGLSLQAAVRFMTRPDAIERVERAVDDLDDTVRDIRSAIFELQSVRPSNDPAPGLRRRVLDLGAEFSDGLGFDPTFRFDGAIDTMVPDEIAEHVVAVVREGLANVARHARAASAQVTLKVGRGRVDVAVTDDGRGPGGRRSGGHGLVNVLERAQSLGGNASLEAVADRGALLRWSVPLA